MAATWVKRQSGEGNHPLIIFVHGWASGANSCWSKSTGSSWPQIVAADPAFDAWDIYVAEYFTRAFTSGDFSVEDASTSLWTQLSAMNVIDGRPLLFVCHSMGGLVVRNMIRKNQGPLAGRQTIGILLVASPSNGSAWAWRLRWVASLFGHAQAKQLRPQEGNAWLRHLNEDFRHLRSENRHRILGREIIEHKFIGIGRFLLLRPLVYAIEGTGVFDERPEKIANSSHVTITKPDDATAQQHLVLTILAKKVMDGALTCSVVIPPNMSFEQVTAIVESKFKQALSINLLTGPERASRLDAVIEEQGWHPAHLLRRLIRRFPEESLHRFQIKDVSGVVTFVEP